MTTRYGNKGLKQNRLVLFPASPPFWIGWREPTHKTPKCCDAQQRGESRLTINPNGELNRAVVLGDSFFWALEPFVSEHWQRVRYAWGADFPSELIEQERPELVVQEMVERRLMIYDPTSSHVGNGSAGCSAITTALRLEGRTPERPAPTAACGLGRPLSTTRDRTAVRGTGPAEGRSASEQRG